MASPGGGGDTRWGGQGGQIGGTRGSDWGDKGVRLGGGVNLGGIFTIFPHISGPIQAPKLIAKKVPDHFRQHIRPFGPFYGANSI